MTKSAQSLSPDERIAIIQHSLRSLKFGIWSAIPLLVIPPTVLMLAWWGEAARLPAMVIAGIIPAISLPLSLLAALNHRQARRVARGNWNPARTELIWGEVLSSLGVLAGLVVLTILVIVWMQILP